MVRNYRIQWYKNERFGESIHRTTFITLSKATGKVDKDGKRALEIFLNDVGSLKYNTIIKIQEFDENMNQIGEDIIPQEGSAIVPTAK